MRSDGLAGRPALVRPEYYVEEQRLPAFILDRTELKRRRAVVLTKREGARRARVALASLAQAANHVPSGEASVGSVLYGFYDADLLSTLPVYTKKWITHFVFWITDRSAHDPRRRAAPQTRFSFSALTPA